jgi:hypothetical protein
MTGLADSNPRKRRDKISEGDPAVVRSSDSVPESQAGLNGPSGSPISSSEPDPWMPLARLIAAVHSENFNRRGRGEMSTNLRVALRDAEAVFEKQKPRFCSSGDPGCNHPECSCGELP